MREASPCRIGKCCASKLRVKVQCVETRYLSPIRAGVTASHVTSLQDSPSSRESRRNNSLWKVKCKPQNLETTSLFHKRRLLVNRAPGSWGLTQLCVADPGLKDLLETHTRKFPFASRHVTRKSLAREKKSPGEGSDP